MKSAITPIIWLSLCVTCKGRKHHLAQTLRANLDAISSFDGVELVLLDYNSEDGLALWIFENFSDYITSGRLVFYRTPEPIHFNRAHAKNMAHKLARGKFVCNIDADNYFGKDFIEYIREKIEEFGEDIVIHSEQGVLGRIVILKKNFLALGGYDEDMNQGWGVEDRNLCERAGIFGLRDIDIPRCYSGAIEHSNDERAEFDPLHDIRMSDRIHSEISTKKIAAGEIIANVGREWGTARLDPIGKVDKRGKRYESFSSIILTTLLDDSYVIPAAAMLESAALNSAPGKRLAIYILSDGVSQENLAHLVAILSKHSVDCVVVNMNIWLMSSSVRSLNAKMMQYIPARGHVSKTTYLKAFIPDVIPTNFGTVLYIDPDTIFEKDIASLWSYDVSGYPLAAVIDPYLPRGGVEKFNAGVMLLNLVYLRKFDMTGEFFQTARDHRDVIKEGNDQPVFNILFGDKFMELPPTYNYIVHDLHRSKNFLWSPHIVHFAGSRKPWHVLCTHKYRAKFRSYLKASPWASRLARHTTGEYLYEAYTPRIIRRWFEGWKVWEGRPFSEWTFRIFRKYYIEKIVPYSVRIKYEGAKAKFRKLEK